MLLKGSILEEILKRARMIYRQIEHKTKRRPYIRSSYFGKDKVFFDYFWHHLSQNNRKTRTQRLKYFAAALDLIKHSNNPPLSKQNLHNIQEIFHRFYGLTKEKFLFCVQIKEIKKGCSKYFMSVFSPHT